MAPRRFQIVLALEIATPLRPTDCVVGNSPVNPRDERRQPVVGCSAHPWGASQARRRCRPDQRGQVYGAVEGPSLAGMEDVPRNHAEGIAAMDLFVVPTISFRLLYGLLIVGHGRRQILWLGVTTNPTAEWIANQLTEACGWEQIPRYLIRDRDGAYGEIFTRRVRSIGIRDRPTSPRSPWQNAYAERLIGSIRRECLDHIVVFTNMLGLDLR